MKTIMPLEMALKLKSDIEEALSNTYSELGKMNFTQELHTKMTSKWTQLLLMEDQLVHLKEVIQTANTAKRFLLFGSSNNTTIYTLSNLMVKRKFYGSIQNKVSNASEKRKSTSYFLEGQISKKLDTLQTRITELQLKLEKFNKKKRVLVTIVPELEYLVKKI